MRDSADSLAIFRLRRIALLSFVVAGFLVFAMPSSIAAQANSQSNVVISQVYTRGGEPGAAYQNDFIDIFNRGDEYISITQWSLVMVGMEGAPSETRVFTLSGLSSGVNIGVGRHYLVKLGGSGTNGQPLDPDFAIPANLSSTGGTIFLVKSFSKLPEGCPVAPDAIDGIVDSVGYGTTKCFEGTAAPAPSPTKSLMRINGGCTDSNNNLSDFALTDADPHSLRTVVIPCHQQSPSIIDFAASQFEVREGDELAKVTLARNGDISTPASVEYETSGGTASANSDYNFAIGTVFFAPGETQKSFELLITDDSYVEPDETIEVTLRGTTGNADVYFNNSARVVIHDNDLSPQPNMIDNSNSFVGQHYHDFLNRVPDNSGFQFWVNNIESCGIDVQCREVKRIDTSAAFFLSIEFQNTGFLVYCLYKASLPPLTLSRWRGYPLFFEFERDTLTISRGVIVGSPGWEQLLKNNTDDFINSFAAGPEFVFYYPLSLSPAEYVDKLNAQAGKVLSSTERDALVNGLINQTETRATVLKKIATSPAFIKAEFNHAFVLMQYFAYLRRDPAGGVNPDFSGFDYWVDKLNRFGGDYRAAEMVKAFLNSSEYRARFGN